MDTAVLKKLYESGEGDITIKAKDGEKKAISYILCQVSSVMKAKLTSNTEESKSKIIDMTKYTVQNVDMVLRHIYYDQQCKNILLNGDDDIYELYELADSYQLDHLKKWLNRQLDVVLHFGIESVRARLIKHLLKNSGRYGSSLHEHEERYIAYVVKMLRYNITSYIMCERNHDQAEHSWCCLHEVKPYSTKYEDYIRKEASVKKFGCICTNLKKNLKGKHDINRTYDKENGSLVNSDYSLCCLHRLFDQKMDDACMYNWDYVAELPVEVQNKIHKAIYP